ncbi:LexA family protein [Tetragenococcus solitarius]|uniref:HTH cro/C1-type domain-containing protein n=1 Tax=Tetragenococcus solitarius TaxID=71453 RepID=A0ABN3Y2G1_9ENTE|nr:XRE family transcriptional regulator [Tetragenococcus solitarius]
MKTNDEIMDIFDQLKKEKHLSISEIARRVGMAKSAVSKYFNRTRNFPLNRIEDFARAMDVSPEYILGYHAGYIYSKEITNIPIVQTLSNNSDVVAEPNAQSYYPTASFNLPIGELFYFKMKDNSMTPTIPEDANVLLKFQEDIEDGQVAAITLNEDPTLLLKRVKKQDNFLLLLSENPDYDPIIVTKDTSMQIVGKAIRVSYDL